LMDAKALNRGFRWSIRARTAVATSTGDTAREWYAS
jgi:hypothetical protein